MISLTWDITASFARDKKLVNPPSDGSLGCGESFCWEWISLRARATITFRYQVVGEEGIKNDAPLSSLNIPTMNPACLRLSGGRHFCGFSASPFKIAEIVKGVSVDCGGRSSGRRSLTAAGASCEGIFLLKELPCL